MRLQINPIAKTDYAWIKALLPQYWGSTQIVSRGQLHQTDRLPGFLAVLWGRKVGLITYHLVDRQCEIVSLNSLVDRQGIGTALVEAVRREAVAANCTRLWLITTNDNLTALRFYQKRGFSLVQVHRHAIERSRQLKPDISLVGEHGIPIRDEIELEILIGSNC